MGARPRGVDPALAVRAIVGTVCTPARTIRDGVVIIANGRIEDVRLAVDLPANADVIETRGRLIVPGFIDLHTYGNGGVGVTTQESAAEELRAIARNVARFGVTGFLISPTAGDRAFVRGILAALGEAIPSVTDGARPLGIHLEGPWHDAAQAGAFPVELVHPSSIEEAEEYLQAAKGCLRLVTLAPNLPNAIETAMFLHRKGVLTSLGHSDAMYETARDALASGAFDAITHVFNAMSGFHHRMPGVVGAALSSDRVFGLLICDGVHVHPAAVKIMMRAFGTERVVLVTDAGPGAGTDADSFVNLGRMLRVADGAARLPDGTIAGSVLTMNRAVRNAQELGDLSLGHALAMATVNPAKLMGLDRKGRLEAGADADLTVMDEHFDVVLTMVSGQIVYER